MKSAKKYPYKEYLANIFPCIGYGILCGSVTGAVIVFFKWAAHHAEYLSRRAYQWAGRDWVDMILGVGVLGGCSVMMYFLHKKIPEVAGGGIPRSEGVIRGILTFRWWKTLVATILGSMISFFCGLPLGSEGPAVLIGTSLGGMCVHFSSHKNAWSRYIMSGGAGAGFAVATGAPLSGILFVLEEIHKRYSPTVLLTVATSVLSATYVNRLLCSWFRMSPNLLELDSFPSFQLHHVGYLLLLGILLSLAVAVFDASITWFSDKKKRLPQWFRLLAVFGTTGILGFFFADGIYSGHDTILTVMHQEKTIWYLIFLLLVRMIMMRMVTSSSATGGIFIPTLAIGSLFGAMATKALIFLGMPVELFPTAVLLGMCSFLGGTLRAPLTATVFFLELTGQFTDLFYATLVVFTVHLITELFHQIPFYDTVLSKMEKKQNQGKDYTIACFQMKVSRRAFVVGKTVRDILWPASSAFVSITRANDDHADLDRDGEKKLYSGDTIVLRIRYTDESEVVALLAALVGEEHPIQKVKDPSLC